MATSEKTPQPRKSARTGRTPKTRAREDWAPAFLKAFEEQGTVIQACRQVGVGRSTVYDRREKDEQFAADWQEVEESVVEEMEREARRRAVEGVENAHFDKDGNLLWTETRYSDTLLIFLLKARRPAVYRENVTVKHTGPDGGPVKHELDAAIPGVREGIDAALTAAHEAERAARRD